MVRCGSITPSSTALRKGPPWWKRVPSYLPPVSQCASKCTTPTGSLAPTARRIPRAVGDKEPVGVVHFDAHCDTGGKYDGTRFHHGGPFRNAVLDGVIDPQRTIQIGIRGSSEYLWEFSADSG